MEKLRQKESEFLHFRRNKSTFICFQMCLTILLATVGDINWLKRKLWLFQGPTVNNSVMELDLVSPDYVLMLFSSH